MSDIGDLIDQDASLRTLAPAAVGSQVLLMSIISVVTVLVFNVLRPRNKIVYEPKSKYHEDNKVPPRTSDSILGWVSPLIHVKEPELVDKIGLDAAMFLRFLRMLRLMFTAIAVLTCAALIPVNVVYNLRNVPSANRDALSMLTIRDITDKTLFVHVAVSYLITGLVLTFVYLNWVQVIRLRREWFRSPEYVDSFYARTLMVTGVPKKLQSDEGIKAIFQTIQVPYPTTSVHIGRRVGRLYELIEYHNKTVKELEHVLVKYLKDGKVGKKRPTIRVGGFMCCGGEVRDAIDFYTERLKKTEAAVEQQREHIDDRKPEKYGFASMAAVPYAHVVANLLRNKHPKGTTITLAPNPKDLVWQNLSKSKSELSRNNTIGWLLLIAVCFFNTVPLLIISILANLASLTTYVPFLQSWSQSSPGTFTFISGVLPPAVSALFGFVLPIIMRGLIRYQGAFTHSRLDRAVIARYFSFLVISQLIVFTLIGVIFNSVKEIITQIGAHKSFQEIVDNLDKLPATINRTYIDQASYWLTYFPLRGFLVLFDLAQILNLVVIRVKTRLFGRTPREHREWTQPPEFQYAIYYSNMLFMCVVGLFFAPLAPLVAVAAAAVFWLSSWVYKYQLMFVFVSRVETGGRIWNVVINRVLVAVLLMQALMTLTIGLQLKFRSFLWVSTLPPYFIVLGFKWYIRRKLSPSFEFYQPTEEELRLAHVHSKRADMAKHKLEKRFGHPALTAELFTPMVHANMTHLLAEVYTGKVSNVQTKVEGMSSAQVDATVVAGGIKIAGIEQRDLEYDPALYRRDRGELNDIETASISSSNLLAADTAGRASPAPSKLAGYDRYMQGSQPDIELARLDIDKQPLLHPMPSQQTLGYFDPTAMASRSNTSLPSYAEMAPVVQPPQGVPPMPAAPAPYAYAYPPGPGREAQVHRPYPPSREPSGYATVSPASSPDLENVPNAAGRGAFMGGYGPVPR